MAPLRMTSQLEWERPLDLSRKCFLSEATTEDSRAGGYKKTLLSSLGTVGELALRVDQEWTWASMKCSDLDCTIARTLIQLSGGLNSNLTHLHYGCRSPTCSGFSQETNS